MLRSQYIALLLVFSVVFFKPFSVSGNELRNGAVSHAEAVVVFSKYLGLFDRYVEDQASLDECIRFLNGHGVYFGMLQVVNGKGFTASDCARVMGQIELLFSGEGEKVSGRVILPKGFDSWSDFCIMNNVQYVQGYERINEMAAVLRQMRN